MAKTTKDSFTPPYNITLRTLLNLLDKMAEHPALPDKIDRSYLHTMSGSAQTAFLTAGRDFGLIDAEEKPTDRLRKLVYDAESRPRIFEELLQEYYAPIVESAQDQTTAKQLTDIWRDLYGQEGETLRKAISFFMQAADYCGLEVSPHWKKGMSKTARSSSTTKARSRKKTSASGSGVVRDVGTRAESSYKQTVELSNDAGKVTVEIALDPFKGSDEDRNFVFSLVDMMRTHQEKHAPQGPCASEPLERTADNDPNDS